MRIVTIVRTLNEEEIVDTFLEQYNFSDLIIVSDGGSTDNTVKLVKKHKDVIVLEDFHFKIPLLGMPGHFTDEPRQINFLIDAAMPQRPDWIIYDDCDCWPSRDLKTNARLILKHGLENNYDTVAAYRYYMYKKTSYFPKMNMAGQSLWAWNPNRVTVRCLENVDPTEQNLMFSLNVLKEMKLEPPQVLLHHFYRSDEHIRRKMEFYSGKGKAQAHPLKAFGDPEPIPSYAEI